ncbi:hypothetical protein H310_04791 [Aphanomyces invadans]|uniref:FYVE-type domain-containing protein n=1 Tax=Aphanomyces invadans TaxID=157072 RepID=A0A024UA47_9STRA|nr:hypothetical protein H310_04791 [Aphanomyces invadans]ETW03286.1 hypothetical protein H310_04791 [Aphanomyces invadans]|eukprot:XP_008867515.1 hypothetical protein H310_04791 [Aphanomyces invadans]
MTTTYYEVHLDHSRAIDGVKFIPPKHWVIHHALTIQTVDGAATIDHIAPGNRLHAINGQRIHEMQFAHVVERLRNIAGPFTITIEDAKPAICRWGDALIQVDTSAWTVQLPHGPIVAYPCFVLDLLREAAIGITAGDVLVAVNGMSVVALTDRSVLQTLHKAKQQPVVQLEWAKHSPRAHSYHLRKSHRTAWAVMSELHAEPKHSARRCCLCNTSFGIFKRKKSCTVCGHVVCSPCQAKCVVVVSSIPSHIKFRSCLRCAHMASSSG